MAATIPSMTFSRDAWPILESRCVSCHQAGEIAPMAFLTYEQVRPYAKAIKSDILQHKMPPWPADPPSRNAL